MTETTAPTPPPPAAAAARPLTPSISRRAWTYPTVRFWWILAAVFAAAALYFAVQSYLRWSQDVRLLRTGVVVEAKMWEAGLADRINNRPIPPNRAVELEYEYQGKSYSFTNTYLPDPSIRYMSGTPAELRIDPDRPTVWTNRVEPPSLVRELLGPLLLLPPILIAAAVSVLLRRRVLYAYRHGAETAAVVVDTKQSALAPLSQSVRCTPADAPGRLLTVFVPQSHGRLAKGDPLTLYTHPHRSGVAVPAPVFT